MLVMYARTVLMAQCDLARAVLSLEVFIIQLSEDRVLLQTVLALPWGGMHREWQKEESVS